MGGYSRIVSREAYERAMALARGVYQRALIEGREAISGATLRGKAKKYGGRYQASAHALIDRLNEAGIPCGIETGTHGQRILVIGEGVSYEHHTRSMSIELPRLRHDGVTHIPAPRGGPNARVTFVESTPLIFVDRHDGKLPRCQTWLALDVIRHEARAMRLSGPHDATLRAFAEDGKGTRFPVPIEWVAEFQRAVTMAAR